MRLGLVDELGQVRRVVPLGSGDDVTKGQAIFGIYNGVELLVLVPFLLSVLATGRVMAVQNALESLIIF